MTSTNDNFRSRFVPGIELDEEMRDELRTAVEFDEAASEIFDITKERAEAKRAELAEIAAAVTEADIAHERSARAVELAHNKLLTLMRAYGLVFTADGIAKAPAAEAPAEPVPTVEGFLAVLGHEAPPVGSAAREATASPYAGHHEAAAYFPPVNGDNALD